jgi:hypothetical protein
MVFKKFEALGMGVRQIFRKKEEVISVIKIEMGGMVVICRKK